MVSFAFMALSTSIAQEYAVTPVPNIIEKGAGSVDISKGLSLYIDSAVEEDVVRLESAAEALGVKIKRVKRPTRHNGLNLIIVDQSEISGAQAYDNFEEGYELYVYGSGGIDIKATTATGLYYGLQTLKQIYENSDGEISEIYICDAPRFEYRGILIEIGRAHV